MRINNMENSAAFKSLKINESIYYHLSNKNIKSFEKKLANTKHIDVIIDSHGFSLKDKKTELLNWIQSFSLFTQENAVGINLLGDSKKTFKIYFKNIDEAKKLWDELRISARNDSLETYTKTALILDKQIDYKC